MAKTRSQYVAMNTSIGFLYKILDAVMQFALRTVFIYTLGVEYAGVSSLFTSILSMLSLAELGLGSAITYALYAPIKSGDTRQIARLMNFYRFTYRLVAAVVFFGGLCLIPFLNVIVTKVPNVRESLTLLYVLYLLKSASSYLLIYRSALLTASEKRYVISLTDCAFLVIRIAVQLVLLFVFRDFLLYLIAEITFSLLRNVAISRFAKRSQPILAQYADEQLPREEKHAFLVNVAAMAMYNISLIAIRATDDIVISSMIGTAVVGLVANYKSLRFSLESMMDQFYSALAPSIGTSAANPENSGEKQYAVFRNIQFLSFWSSCFCSCALAVLMEPFIRDIWLGADYLLPGAVMFSLIIDFYVNNTVRIFSSFRNGNGLFVQGKWCPVYMAFINVALSFALAKPLGAFGVLIATVISRLATQFWYDPKLVFGQLFHRSLKTYYATYFQHTFITLVCCVLTCWLGSLVSLPNRYLSFAVLVVICLIVPNGVIWLLYRKTEPFQYCQRKIYGAINKMKKKRGKGLRL